MVEVVREARVLVVPTTSAGRGAWRLTGLNNLNFIFFSPIENRIFPGPRTSEMIGEDPHSLFPEQLKLTQDNKI